MVTLNTFYNKWEMNLDIVNLIKSILMIELSMDQWPNNYNMNFDYNFESILFQSEIVSPP